MNLKHLKNILNTYSDSKLEKMEIKIGGYIEQEGDRNNESK